MYLTPKERAKALKKVTWQKPANSHQPVFNPVKERLKAGWRFAKLFWALIVLGIIFFIVVKYGERWGVRLNW